jgi:hypothetical protein
VNEKSFLDARRLMPPCCISTLKMVSLMQPFPGSGRKSQDLRTGSNGAWQKRKFAEPDLTQETGACRMMRWPVSEVFIPLLPNMGTHRPIISSMHSI